MSHVPISGTNRALVAAAIVIAMTSGIGLTTTIGTVQAVDPNAHELAVVTGRGYALRTIVFQVEPGKAEGPSLATVKPGQIVEVHHRKISGREVALSIEILPPEQQRGQP